MTAPEPPAALQPATAPTHPRRLVYLGTPAMAVPPLVALHEAGFDIALVVTRVDKRRGRGSATSPSPVKAAALDLGLDVGHDLAAATEVDADLGVVVAYGRIIPIEVLAALPMVNIHFSLLPRWRGAAPVERALLAGDPTTGVCLMEVAEGLDTGDVYATREVPITDDDDLDTLRRRLVEVGSSMLVSELTAGLATPVAQEGEPVYAAKLTTDDMALDVERPAAELARIVRLGRAWTMFRGRRLKVLAADVIDERTTAAPGSLDGVRVSTGDGLLELVTVQPEGKKTMAARDWINGVRPESGERLG
ncbi:MAG: methionyl-tRNA formyltransferase [Actinomycetota bacterium]